MFEPGNGISECRIATLRQFRGIAAGQPDPEEQTTRQASACRTFVSLQFVGRIPIRDKVEALTPRDAGRPSHFAIMF
jgi:hypothetical protein